MHMTGLYERGQAFSAPDDEARAASAEFAYCELLLGGVTSLVDISAPWDGWIELFAKSGMRGFLAPGYASARWFLENDHEIAYDWDEHRGRAGFAAALRVIDAALGAPQRPALRASSRRCRSTPAPRNCCATAAPRRASAACRSPPHVSQSVNEVREMIRRHGLTPIQWANRLGILGPGTILGHALFLDTHSWVRWHSKTDLAILGDSGAAVAHCPTPFARYGQVMEHFGDYLRRRGADGARHRLQRRTTSSRRCARRRCWRASPRATSMRSTIGDFFHAATVGGADALLRGDIGRLAPGMKADLVLVDLACPQMQPVRDPLRAFVYHAADRAVRDVFVDGRQVVADRQVLTLDQADAAVRVRAAQERMESAAPQRDYLRRTAEEITPLSLPVIDNGS